MMVLWDKKETNVKELGEKLFLDSGTLTPLLKKLESKGYITRKRSETDERNLIVSITVKGMELRDRALSVPEKMSCCVKMDKEKADELYKLLYEALNAMNDREN
jgi:DNA-binding MarR family transcriptional regulator